MKKILSFVLITVISLSACAHASKDEMYTLASALLKVTAATESAVRYKGAPSELKDYELVKFATKHDPNLLSPLKGYTVKASSVATDKGKRAVLLVCNKKGTVALLEDAGCSAALDKHRWQQSSPCAFSLNIYETCSQ